MKIDHATIFFLKWDTKRGLIERSVTFETLTQLFCCCRHPEPGETVDRIVIEGSGGRVTLAFQNAKTSDKSA